MNPFKNKLMALPIPDQPQIQWLQFITALLPWATIFGLVWKAIDMVFKYYSNAQDMRLRMMIQQEVKPDITSLKADIGTLTTAINELREGIGELKGARGR